MKKVLNAIDKGVGWLFLNLGGFLTAGTFFLVLYTILCRYVFHTNTGGFDELSTYFVICSVWTGAVLCSRNVNDGQIKIDFLSLIIKSKKGLMCVDVFWQIISIVAQGIFTVLAYNYVGTHIKRGTTLSGLDFPMAVFSGCMFVCSLCIVIYEIRKMIVLIGRIAAKDNAEGGNK